MDKKYIGKFVALPHDTAALVEQVRAALSAKLGFKLSTSQAIAHLATDYTQRQAADNDTHK